MPLQDVEIEVCGILNDTTGTLMSCAWKNRNCRVGVIVGWFPFFAIIVLLILLKVDQLSFCQNKNMVVFVQKPLRISNEFDSNKFVLVLVDIVLFHGLLRRFLSLSDGTKLWKMSLWFHNKKFKVVKFYIHMFMPSKVL